MTTTAAFTLPRGSRSQHVRRQAEISWHLIGQTFNARYRRASLGILWVWAEPLTRMLVFVLVFEKALGIRADSNQTVYLFVGILFIRAASQGLNMATTAPMSNQALVHMAGVDRRIFPIVAIGNAFVDLVLSIPIIWILLVIQGNPIPFQTMWLSVPLMLLQFLLLLGAGFILAAANVHVRDVTLLVQTGAIMLFYLSPVFWSPETIEGSGYEWILDVNPMAPLLMAQRDVLGWGEWPDWSALGFVVVVTAVLLAIGWPLYSRVSHTMADHL